MLERSKMPICQAERQLIPKTIRRDGVRRWQRACAAMFLAVLTAALLFEAPLAQAKPTEPTDRVMPPTQPAEEPSESAESLSESARDSDPLVIETPLNRVAIPYQSRPEWVEMTPVLEGDVHRIAVCSGPFVGERESLRALDEELKKRTDAYINNYLGNHAAAMFLNYPAEEIKRRLVAEPVYTETIRVSFGPMNQTHALLAFDSGFRQELDYRWDQVLATTRLLKTGMGVAAVLGVIGLLFSYFKLDTATRGYYTRRLQLAAAAGILTLVAVELLLAKWIPHAVILLTT